MHSTKRCDDFREEEPLKGGRILSLYYRHKPGGLCKRLYMMFDVLVAAGAEVHYIAVAPYPISHPKIVAHILWTPFQKKEGLFFWVYFLFVAPFYAFSVARKQGIEMVSVFGGVYAFVAIFLKVLLQIPVLTFVRSDTHEIGRVLHHAPVRLFFEHLFLKAGFALSDQIVTVSQALKKTMPKRYGICPDKIAVLNNNITGHRINHATERDTYRQKMGLDEKAFIVTTAAVLDARKNVEHFIEAGQMLKQPALFLIVGDGPERLNLERLANGVTGAARFVFTGWQEDVGSFLNASDLFVLPSRHEGCSNALLEALSLGLPCLGSDILENREVLHSDLLLFDVNDPAALSDKLGQIMSDLNYFERIKSLSGDAGKKLLFDWDCRIVAFHHPFLF